MAWPAPLSLTCSRELEEMLAGGDLVKAFDDFVAMWTGIVREEQFQAGCAVAAGALDLEPDSGARKAAAAGFRRWEELLVEACERKGLTRGRAEGLAVMCISCRREETCSSAWSIATASG